MEKNVILSVCLARSCDDDMFVDFVEGPEPGEGVVALVWFEQVGEEDACEGWWHFRKVDSGEVD